jgi:hypothetical protein
VIEALKDFPDNVIAIACHGHVTKADYETVLIPDIEDKLSRHKKVRIYCEIAPDYGGLDPGAVGRYEGRLQPPPRLGTRRDGH